MVPAHRSHAQRGFSVGLAWQDLRFFRHAGTPIHPRTCCQQPISSSFAVKCLFHTRVTNVLLCGMLSRATKTRIQCSP